MTFITKLTLHSGDRAALDDVVESIRETVRRKGAEFRGPHTKPPNNHQIDQYKGLDGDKTAQYPSWSYTVYRRKIEIVGHDDLARAIMEWDFPESVKVEADIERIQAVGSTA